VQVSNVFKIKKDTLINVKLDQLLTSVEEIKEDIIILKKMDKSDKKL
jgi:hypothetical protein